jgi:hypothetical protein
MTWAKRLKRVFTKSRRLQAILRSKLAISAVLTSGSLPVLKTRQSFRKYSLTWMTMQVLQQQHGCRIAGLRRAYRWVYSTEEINSIMALTYCPHFGNGMADLVPGVRLARIIHQGSGVCAVAGETVWRIVRKIIAITMV